MRGKEKAKGGVLAQQELAESGVDTSANHRGAGHGSAGEQRRGSEHGCGDHRHTTLGNGNRPLDARTVWAGAGYVRKIEKRGGKSGPIAGPILVRKNKNGPGLIWGIIFLFNFPKTLYKL
jgi:hypothetical protein